MVGVGWLPKFGFLVIGRRPILIDFIRFCKKCPNVLVLLEVFWKIICLRPSGFQCFLSYRSHNDHMVGDRHSRWRYFCRNRGGQCAEIADVPLENIFGFLIFVNLFRNWMVWSWPKAMCFWKYYENFENQCCFPICFGRCWDFGRRATEWSVRVDYRSLDCW